MPPSRLPSLLGALVGAAVACLLLLAPPELSTWRIARAPHGRLNPFWHVVLRGGSAHDLADLGWHSEQERSYVHAIAFYRAASAVDRRSLVYRGFLARALAENGDCEAAQRSLAQARGRVRSGYRTPAQRSTLRQAVAAGRACRLRVPGPQADERPRTQSRRSPRSRITATPTVIAESATLKAGQ